MKPREKLKEDELVQRCLRKDRRAQRELYERYGPLMKAVCLRYLFERAKAEEVMNRAFFKVFTRLESYKGNGSFEGWIRKIMVNESLNENKKKKVNFEISESQEEHFLKQAPEVQGEHDVQFIMQVISALPEGYRLVFNLIEIEGYNHGEVGVKLGISESSSRSQLTRAKKLLRQKLKDLQGL